MLYNLYQVSNSYISKTLLYFTYFIKVSQLNFRKIYYY